MAACSMGALTYEDYTTFAKIAAVNTLEQKRGLDISGDVSEEKRSQAKLPS